MSREVRDLAGVGVVSCQIKDVLLRVIELSLSRDQRKLGVESLRLLNKQQELNNEGIRLKNEEQVEKNRARRLKNDEQELKNRNRHALRNKVPTAQDNLTVPGKP